MPPLKLMSPSAVEGVLTSLEQQGKIPHNWRWTWTEAHKVRMAHPLHSTKEMEEEARLAPVEESHG